MLRGAFLQPVGMLQLLLAFAALALAGRWVAAAAAAAGVPGPIVAAAMALL